MGKKATILAVDNAALALVPAGATRMTDLPAFETPEVWAGPRPILETMPAFRQLIPYVIVRNGPEILAYVRAGNEARLHGQLSIGVGGHVDASDAIFDDEGRIELNDTLFAAAFREIDEEIGAEIRFSELKTVGLIKSFASAVDEVHLGFVMVWEADGFFATGGELTYEAELGEPRWMTIEEIRNAQDVELESWTKLALDLL